MTVADRQAAYSGTKEVPENLAFDTAVLAEWLAPRIPGFAGPLGVRQFKGGQSNPTYLLTTPTRRYVLRRKPPGKLLASAHAVDREFRVLSALHKQGFPVAEPLVYCDDEAIIGTAFYAMSHADGRVLWVPTLPGSPAAERSAIYDAMNATIARLHAFDPAKIGLSDFGKADGYVARQVKRWSEQYRLSETQDIPEMNRVMEWLPEHVPPTSRPALVHGDYRLDNLILHKSEPQVTAVIDWELATIGDPNADFVYHCMTWIMPAEKGGGTGSLVNQDLAALGIPALDDYIAAYAKRMNLAEIPHIETLFAYNFFRLAAILQGIVGRVRDGTASNENAAAMANEVRPLAAAAWSWAQKAGAA